MTNARQRNAENCRWPAMAAFLTVVAVLLSHYAVKYGLNTPPSPSGDEISYDIIGWNLAHGHGFAEGGNDPEFFRPYEQSVDPEDRWLIQRMSETPELVAYRPPLFPMLLSLLNRAVGRQFRAVRIMNVLATAGTGALLVWHLCRTQSKPAAAIGLLLFLIVDTRTRLFGRAILTEATATFLFTIITLLLITLQQRWSWKTVILSGAAFGLLILDRTVFALWLPGLAVLVCVLSRQTPARESDRTASPRPRWSGVMSAAAFVLAAVLVVAPWAIRNVRVLDAMMPLGTQGMSQLPAGFSDHAFRRHGIWDKAATQQLQQQLGETFHTRLERDVARAQLGKQQAFDWIRSHPLESLQLVGMKIVQEYRPRSTTAWLITICSLIGLFLTWRQPDTRLFLALHAVSCIVIGGTWSVEGRFVMPLMMTTHVLAAVALVYPLRFLTGRSSRTDR